MLDFVEMERRKKEEAERKAKLDEIAEKQRQRERELDEKEKRWREEVLGRTAAPPVPSRTEPSAMAPPVEVSPVAAPAAAAAPAAGKYVPPKLRRSAAETPGQAPANDAAPGSAPRAETDKWSRPDNRPSQFGERWRDDRRPAYGGSGPRSTWQSSRER